MQNLASTLDTWETLPSAFKDFMLLRDKVSASFTSGGFETFFPSLQHSSLQLNSHMGCSIDCSYTPSLFMHKDHVFKPCHPLRQTLHNGRETAHCWLQWDCSVLSQLSYFFFFNVAHQGVVILLVLRVLLEAGKTCAGVSNRSELVL